MCAVVLESPAMSRWICVVVCMVLATTASAQSLDDADALYESRDVMAARAGYRSAIDAGGLEPAELARAHRRLGIIAAVTGDIETAKAEFRQALAIEPDAPPPVDLAPDQRAEFERLATAASPVSVTLEEQRRAGSVLLTATVRGGDALSARGRVLWNSEAREGLELTGEDFGTQLSKEVEAVAIDEHGNVAARTRVRVETPAVAPEASPTGAAVEGSADSGAPAESPSDEGMARGWKIAIAVVAVLVAGGIVGGVVWATRTEEVRYQCCEIAP